MTKGEQMMVDLGYEPDKVCYTEEKAFKKQRSDNSYFRISFAKSEVKKEFRNNWFLQRVDQTLTYNELLACAEIIKEIKGNDKKKIH